MAELFGSEFTLFAAALAALAITGLAIVRDLGASRPTASALSAVVIAVPVAPAAAAAWYV
jgi:hypothetical protein